MGDCLRLVGLDSYSDTFPVFDNPPVGQLMERILPNTASIYKPGIWQTVLQIENTGITGWNLQFVSGGNVVLQFSPTGANITSVSWEAPLNITAGQTVTSGVYYWRNCKCTEFAFNNPLGQKGIFAMGNSTPASATAELSFVHTRIGEVCDPFPT